MPYTGKLSVFVTYGGSAFPVDGASVRIFGESAAVRDIEYVQFTDENGRTETLTLPAPPPAMSENPEPSSAAAYRFTVEITMRNFYEKSVAEVSVFPGIRTFLPVNLIPYSEFASDKNQPMGTETVVAQDNPRL